MIVTVSELMANDLSWAANLLHKGGGELWGQESEGSGGGMGGGTKVFPVGDPRRGCDHDGELTKIPHIRR